jgi:hypothetical protein
MKTNDGVRAISDREYLALLAGDLDPEDFDVRSLPESDADEESDDVTDGPVPPDGPCQMCGADEAWRHSVLGVVCPTCCAETANAAHQDGMDMTEELFRAWLDGARIIDSGEGV